MPASKAYLLDLYYLKNKISFRVGKISYNPNTSLNFNNNKMKYTVIVGRNETDLIEQVNAHLAAGWALQGGVAITKSALALGMQDIVYCQAMIKQ